ncbi:MAG TPA: Sua5/YciO/YrdC/YwlC family protein, partial [SAR324 cluster bacterium]|nr:Sua5/YciO/YrdC/YwlC family protein [SAR324 cluster bacterium]
IGTSANLSGLPTCLNPTEVQNQFGEKTPMLVNSGILPENLPTSLLDCSKKPFELIRSGSIDLSILEGFI